LKSRFCRKCPSADVTGSAPSNGAVESKIPTSVRREGPVYKGCREQSIPLIINIAFMNFYIDLSRVALPSYPIYRPPTEHPIMKRQLLLSLTLSMLASTAFALPAADQATPQVKDTHSVFSQTVAADGSDRTPGQTIAEGGNDRLKEKGLITEDGYDKTPQGQTVAEDGYDQTPQGQTVAEDGYDQTPQGQSVAEGGGDRVIERNSAMS
jgi:hypothetical protein